MMEWKPMMAVGDVGNRVEGVVIHAAGGVLRFTERTTVRREHESRVIGADVISWQDKLIVTDMAAGRAVALEGRLEIASCYGRRFPEYRHYFVRDADGEPITLHYMWEPEG